jgi:hypothetical protein
VHEARDHPVSLETDDDIILQRIAVYRVAGKSSNISGQCHLEEENRGVLSRVDKELT